MKVLLSLVLAFLITGGAVVARAVDTEDTRQSLKGLKGIYVLVEELKPEVERAGLTEEAIQTDVELKLRLAGIPVLEDLANLASPYYLYVAVSTNHMSDGIWPFHISVELVQKVLLDRDRSTISYSSTWSTGSTGRVGKAKVRTVRDSIKDLVDRFINAYLSVNPK